ncbi:MAG: TrmH family RNA methyltransferase [Lacipirellulaceae bacterium]
MSFEHVRHRPPRTLQRERELVLACVPLRSKVNLSRIARCAGCCAVPRIVAAAPARLDPEIARDAVQSVKLDVRRSLAPALKELRAEGYRIVGLEQTTESHDLHHYRFERRTALVIGNERGGLDDEILALCDDTVEVPVWGLPHSYNVATATVMALYEYCRQFPDG